MKRKTIHRRLLVMLAVAAGIMGTFVLAAYWLLGLWIPWGTVLLAFGGVLFVELLLAAIVYWMYERYE